jgi:hypothetical protein|nr:MAG TPA: hypothetical protein [Caudoviricetes sp.]
MAVKKVIRPEDLHEDDFDIVDNKVRVRPTIKMYNLKYAAPDTVITTQMPVDYDKIGRHYLSVAGIQGNIHVDFKMVVDSGPRRALYVLPTEAPTPVQLIEEQTFDGSSIWVDAGSRTVMGNGLKAGTRYILNLGGYFE